MNFLSIYLVEKNFPNKITKVAITPSNIPQRVPRKFYHTPNYIAFGSSFSSFIINFFSIPELIQSVRVHRNTSS